MTPTPPTSAGRLWLTLADGSEVLGCWGQASGYRVVGDTPIQVVIENSDESWWHLDLNKPEHDVVDWRPLVPEGEVSWEVQVLATGSRDNWLSWATGCMTRGEAEHYRLGAVLDDRDVRIVKVICVVEAEESPAKTAGEGPTDNG